MAPITERMSAQLVEVLGAEQPETQVVELQGAFGFAPKARKDTPLSALAVEAAKLMQVKMIDCRSCQVPATLTCGTSESSLLSLEAVVAMVGPLRESATAEVASGLFLALAHLHSQGILHRNLTGEHVLINFAGGVVLSGLGNAVDMDDAEAMCKRVGTPGFAAPEVIVGAGSSLAVDSFGAGATLYFALRGSPPFTGDLERRIRKTVVCQVRLGAGGPLGFASEACRATLQALLQRDPKDRPTATQLLEGPYWPNEGAQES